MCIICILTHCKKLSTNIALLTMHCVSFPFHYFAASKSVSELTIIGENEGDGVHARLRPRGHPRTLAPEDSQRSAALLGNTGLPSRG